MPEVVVIQRLLQGEVARVVTAGIADDACHFLRYIRRHYPGLDGVFTRSTNQVMQLLAGRRRPLSFAVIDRDAPAAEPLVGSRERQVDCRLYAAGIEDRGALAGLELPQSYLRPFITVPARGNCSVNDAQCLAVDQCWIESGYGDSVRKRLDRRLHLCRR